MSLHQPQKFKCLGPLSCSIIVSFLPYPLTHSSRFSLPLILLRPTTVIGNSLFLYYCRSPILCYVSIDSILHFNMRRIRKLVIAGQPKSLPGFLKSLPCFPKSLPGFPIRYMIMITEISNFLCCRQWKAYPVSQKVYTVSQKVYPISPGCLFRKPGRLFGKLRRLFGKQGRLFGKQGRLFGKQGRLFRKPDSLFRKTGRLFG